ncbi:MAG TPA: flagellar motor switch protein FliG [Nitrospirae bacterium]|nr:flagellar motor switch protein FliG [bacterium BMS3Abin06]HDH10921.1 flagellar motor switch protein FliG [Nitrospirota bacterium]HDZ00415.1 flagellar motor switch protein FliG [Nitrospirota bacterium]
MPINGYEKAAIFLSAVGEDVAAQILRNLDPEDIGKVSSYMSKIKKSDLESREDVFKETLEKVTSGDVQVSGEEYVKNILTKGLGGEDAERILEMVSKESPLESLKWVNAKTLSNYLSSEHPQTIALILCLLEPEQASEVITSLPEQLRNDVAMRVAATDRIPESALEEIEEVLKVQLEMGKGREGKSFNGTKVIAEILNQCERGAEQEILDQIEEKNSEMAESIRELMLVFDDLEEIDDRGIQLILKELSTEDLSLALKTASDALKNKIFANMSQRAAKILKEDMEAKGPVKVSDVENAQKNIVKVARKLNDEGSIVIAGRGKEEVIV